MGDKLNNIKEELSDVLELPKEVVLDLPKISLIGKMQLIIENHKGIIEYTPMQIRIASNSGMIKIQGNHLYIKIIVKEEIIITGEIEAFQFIP
ncbi:sporulation protein YqfC [Garciella nitratireducens]|uniref:Sporulation protein YqfC n=1 Tax=Garciella nitratireducens DSM 15102 TaxID=1121911 RepID=A0A1T4JRH0_9FIRM|nr:sporulation protein YqfC [Garciella nitratireducens]RBP45498.1 sporulation protein YqfC [Garciella nitratireducens]SJZ32734.1 sporulation protein YqfC [Garciella nitratireducens DSM 15102]